MDIKGAKALKKRLGSNGADETVPASVAADIPEDAPPVYRWVGVRKAAPGIPLADADDASATAGSA